MVRVMIYHIFEDYDVDEERVVRVTDLYKGSANTFEEIYAIVERKIRKKVVVFDAIVMMSNPDLPQLGLIPYATIGTHAQESGDLRYLITGIWNIHKPKSEYQLIYEFFHQTQRRVMREEEHWEDVTYE